MYSNVKKSLKQENVNRTGTRSQRTEDLIHFSDLNQLHEVPVQGVGNFYISKTEMALVTDKGDYLAIDEKNFDLIEKIFAA